MRTAGREEGEGDKEERVHGEHCEGKKRRGKREKEDKVKRKE